MPIPSRSRNNQSRLRFETLEPRLTMHAGDLDLSFGNGGQVEAPIYQQSAAPLNPIDIEHQDDGKLLVLATASLIADDPIERVERTRLSVMRLLSNGSLDKSFDADGSAVIPLANPIEAGNIVAQADGTILVAFAKVTESSVIAVVSRLTQLGAIDTSFGENGFAEVKALTGGAHVQAAVQSDGKIIVAALTSKGIEVARLSAAGTSDSSFAGGLQTAIVDADAYSTRFSIGLQDDDQILVAQTTVIGQAAGYVKTLVVRRFLENGSADGGFGEAGSLKLEFMSPLEAERPFISAQPSGGIAVAVSTKQGESGQATFLRLDANGALDPAFGVGGRVAITNAGGYLTLKGLEPLVDGRLSALVEVPDSENGGFIYSPRFISSQGKIEPFDVGDVKTYVPHGGSAFTAVKSSGRIVGVFSKIPLQYNDSSLGVAQWSSTGTLDPTFGNDGVAILSPFPASSRVAASQAKTLSDGSIVTAGTVLGPLGMTAPFAAKFDRNGNPDLTFANNGVLTDPAAWGEDGFPRAYLVDQGLTDNGQLVALGLLNGNFFIKRYTADGQVDHFHDLDGIVTLPTVNVNTSSVSMAIQSDGSVLVVISTFGSTAASPFSVYRIDRHGVIDGAYGAHISAALQAKGAQRAIKVALDGDRLMMLSSGNAGYQLVRFASDGQLDQSFGNQGSIVVDNENTGFPQHILVGGDGSVTIAFNRLLNQHTLLLRRYLATGEPDALFGENGRVLVALEDSDVRVASLASDLDDALLVGVIFNGSDVKHSQIVRLHSDGTLDASFGNNGVSTLAETAYTDALGEIVFSGANLLVVGAVDTLTTTNLQLRKIELDRPANLWQNVANPLNASGDEAQAITPLDALLVINELNRSGPHRLGFSGHVAERPTTYVDVNGDGEVSPLDALIVVNWLNANPSGLASLVGQSLPDADDQDSALVISHGEGEAAAAVESVDAALSSYFWDDPPAVGSRRRR